MPDDLFGPSTMAATRREALRRMDGFAPAMGKRYASRRNYDLGPGQHRGVSQLSPYIRRRLVTEPEVIRAAVTQHGPDGAEKFIQEVVWRGYFKGWLERRPQVWTEYRTGLGSAILHGAVASSNVDISVDYTGTVWTNELKRTDNPGRGLPTTNSWIAAFNPHTGELLMICDGTLPTMYRTAAVAAVSPWRPHVKST